MQAQRDETRELFREHVALLLDNDHATYLHRRRLVVDAASRGDGASADYNAGEALHAWLEDALREVVDSGEYARKAQWRTERERAANRGNIANAPTWRSYADSVPANMALLVGELIGCALVQLDWLDMARDELDSELGDCTPRDLAATLSALREVEAGEDADPTGTGVSVHVVARARGLDVDALAVHLAELGRLGLAGSRFVGGTSGTLAHTSDDSASW